MSMYRQLWLAIILSTAIAMLGGLLASTLNARTYLSEQLSAKNIDNATALALALSQQNADTVMIELTVAALFDSGHYELIRIVDPRGKIIVERTAAPDAQAVPEWFVKALPLAAVAGQAQISRGWNQTGTLTLISNSRFAYEALWKSVVQLVLALGFAGLVGGCLGSIVLRRLREPLQRVINQATAISERRFVLIDVPEVPELRQLAIAMNSTVTRLKSIFAEEAQRLEVMRVAANYDHLTGLANRNFFLIQLLDSMDREEAAGSTLLLVRVADYSNRQQLGGEALNEMLKAFAKVLNQNASRLRGVAARMGESDFALLLPGPGSAREVAGTLLQELIKVSRPYFPTGATAFIGAGTLQHGQDIAGLMAQASRALADAEAQGTDCIREAPGNAQEHSSDAEAATARLLEDALHQGKVRLTYFPVLDESGEVVHFESLLELKLETSETWQEASGYMQLAHRFNLTPLIDLTWLRLGLEKLRRDTALAGVSITVSAQSLADADFRSRFLGMVRANSAVADRLWIETVEAEALGQMAAFPDFVIEARKTRARAGLKHFGRHFSQAGLLHDLGLDFLKVDSSFVRGLHFSKDNQIFLRGLASIAKKMGIQVFAEGVIDRAELTAVIDAGFDGAAGPAIRESQRP